MAKRFESSVFLLVGLSLCLAGCLGEDSFHEPPAHQSATAYALGEEGRTPATEGYDFWAAAPEDEPAPLAQDVRTHYMSSYFKNVWNSVQTQSGGIHPVRYIAGNNPNGPIIAGGADSMQLRFTPCYSCNTWYALASPPFPVQGLAGENYWGAIIYGGADSDEVAYISDYASGVWNIVGSRAPWPIRGIAGENYYGPVVFGGYENREVAYLRHYSQPSWVSLPMAPFPIKGIAGENNGGIIVFGGLGADTRRVAYLRYGSNWAELMRAPIDVKGIAGNNGAGPIILGGATGREVYYLNSYSTQSWRKVNDIPYMQEVVGIAGSNYNGVVVTGNN